MGDLLRLQTRPSVEKEPIPEVVDVLEKALVFAKQGKLRSVAICGAVRDDDGVATLRDAFALPGEGSSLWFALGHLTEHLNCSLFKEVSIDLYKRD